MPANDEAGANRIAAGIYTNEAYLVCIPHHNYICIAVVSSHSFRRMLQRGRKLTSMPPPTLLMYCFRVPHLFEKTTPHVQNYFLKTATKTRFYIGQTLPI